MLPLVSGGSHRHLICIVTFGGVILLLLFLLLTACSLCLQYGLRQLDLSLLSQLWSLNESIQEFRQLLQDDEVEGAALSPPSPTSPASPQSSEDDLRDTDELYGLGLRFRAGPLSGVHGVHPHRHYHGGHPRTSTVDFGDV
jgi:hypothetical protein